ncbi:MAG: TerB family tellurite resistance protein [Prevotella sp.]|jgi:hypothetical protein|nr:TerB family tellurite resistance protein [Prevotella sp.]
MEKIIDTIKLMAKTGLFFANSDGNFAERERDFLENFVGGIESVGDISDELKAEVKDTLNHSYDLDGIVKETLQLVEGFNDDERKAILVTTSLFIRKVILSDTRVESKERENYELWKKAVGLA